MLHRREVLALAAAVGLSACASGPTVRSDFDPAVDFSTYSNWTWASETPQPGVSPLTWQRTQDAIARTLQARGFSRTEPAQFAVGFTLGKRDKIQVWNTGPYYSGWGAWGGGGWNTHVTQTTEGTLAIDVFDVATKRPVWQGTATQTLSGQVSQATIDQVVTAVLAKFPPAQTKAD